MKGKAKWVELNHNDYPPIKQAAVLLKYGHQKSCSSSKEIL